MATAAWVDLVVDPELFSFERGGGGGGVWRTGRNRVGEGERGERGKRKTREERRTRGRDRRIMFIVALVIGGFLGAVLYRFGGSSVAIAASGVGKGVVVVGFWFHEGENGDEEEDRKV